MPHKPKPTTTPALIDKAKKCTSAKEVIQTLFTTKHMPNPVERAKAKKIFLKEGIPWPSARGRRREGKPSAIQPTVSKVRQVPPREDDPPTPVKVALAYCPACSFPVYESIDQPCPGCKRDLFVEIHTRTTYSITAK